MLTVDLTCLPLPHPCRILDIGCGSGRHLAAAYGLDQALVIGADPQEGDLKQARQRLVFHRHLGAHGLNSRWYLTAASLAHLPFDDLSFDLVICSEVLEHLPALPPAVSELNRVLVPGGQLVVSFPRPWPETLCWMLSRRYRTTPGGHVRIINPLRLKTMIRSHGFHHWRTHWAHSLHSPYWWLKCLIGVDHDDLVPVKLFHRFLVWDMMARPKATRWLDKILNPLMGKSTVLYFKKRTEAPGDMG